MTGLPIDRSTKKKPKLVRNWHREAEQKIRLRFVGDPDAPEMLHDQPLRVGEVRLLPRRYALYRWWKPTNESSSSQDTQEKPE